MVKKRIDKKLDSGKSKRFVYSSSGDDMLLIQEYARELGISKGRLVREAVKEFLARNRDLYSDLSQGKKVAVKQKGGSIVVVSKQRYDQLNSYIEAVND